MATVSQPGFNAIDEEEKKKRAQQGGVENQAAAQYATNQGGQAPKKPEGYGGDLGGSIANQFKTPEKAAAGQPLTTTTIEAGVAGRSAPAATGGISKGLAAGGPGRSGNFVDYSKFKDRNQGKAGDLGGIIGQQLGDLGQTAQDHIAEAGTGFDEALQAGKFRYIDPSTGEETVLSGDTLQQLIDSGEVNIQSIFDNSALTDEEKSKLWSVCWCYVWRTTTDW